MSKQAGWRIGVWSLDHMHSQSYLGALKQRSDVQWLGVLDELHPSLARQVATELDITCVESPSALLEQAQVVIITSANVEHRAMAVEAAAAGVHALVEKPIATNLADAQAIIDAYAVAGLVLAVAFPCPFSPAFRSLQARCEAGELGDLLAMACTNRGTMPGGFFIDLPRSGGGAVIDHTVHVADLLRRLTNSEPVRVYAEIGHGLYHQPWDDSGLLTVEMSSGAWATLDCSWSRPPSYPTWGDVTLRVIGSKASAYASLFQQHLTHYPATREPPHWVAWGSDLDALMIDDLLVAVREGRPPMSTGEDGLKALQVALAGYQSQRSGGPIEIAALRDA